MIPTNKRFLVALSFPGEHRNTVEQVANCLRLEIGKRHLLYDKFHEAEFARPNLDTHLQSLYHDQSELVVVFLSADFERKTWPGLEWRAIRDLMYKKQASSIMLIRLDDAKVSGVFSFDGYIDAHARQPQEIAELITQRLGMLDMDRRLQALSGKRARDSQEFLPHPSGAESASISTQSTHETIAELTRGARSLLRKGTMAWLGSHEVLLRYEEFVEVAVAVQEMEIDSDEARFLAYATAYFGNFMSKLCAIAGARREFVRVLVGEAANSSYLRLQWRAAIMLEHCDDQVVAEEISAYQGPIENPKLFPAAIQTKSVLSLLRLALDDPSGPAKLAEVRKQARRDFPDNQ